MVLETRFVFVLNVIKISKKIFFSKNSFWFKIECGVAL